MNYSRSQTAKNYHMVSLSTRKEFSLFLFCKSSQKTCFLLFPYIKDLFVTLKIRLIRPLRSIYSSPPQKTELKVYMKTIILFYGIPCACRGFSTICTLWIFETKGKLKVYVLFPVENRVKLKTMNSRNIFGVQRTNSELDKGESSVEQVTMTSCFFYNVITIINNSVYNNIIKK